jgi:hypothetical protein
VKKKLICKRNKFDSVSALMYNWRAVFILLGKEGGTCIFLRGSLVLIDWLLLYVPLKNFSPIWRRHHYRWKAAKFGPMLRTQGLWAVRDFYRATPAVKQGLCFPISSVGPPYLNHPLPIGGFKILPMGDAGCSNTLLAPTVLKVPSSVDRIKYLGAHPVTLTTASFW